MSQPTPAPAPAPVAPPAPAPAVPPVDPAAPPPAPVYVPPASMAPPAPTAPAGPTYVPPIPQPPAPPPVDDGKDWSKLPQWAQQERNQLKDENAQRRIGERAALVNQHAFIAASQLGANPAALLGSTAFGELAKQLNPTAPDFPAALSKAIHDTVSANPWMAAAPAATPPTPPTPGTSGAEFPGGNTAGAPITEAQLAQMTPQQMQKAFEEGRLKHLL